MKSEGSKKWQVVIKKIFCSWKFFVTIFLLSLIVMTSIFAVMLNNAWLMAALKSQNDKINELESKLAQQTETGDRAQLETLLNEIRQLKKDSTTRITQLEDRITQLEESHTIMQETLNSTQVELRDVRARMTELENDYSTTVRALQQALDATERRLNSTISMTSELSSNHSMTVTALQNVEEKLDRATDTIQNVVSNVTSLRDTTSKADETLRKQLSELSETMLNQSHYDQLQGGIDRLGIIQSQSDRLGRASNNCD